MRDETWSEPMKKFPLVTGIQFPGNEKGFSS